MIRKPRSFSLTESGFKALHACERSYRHLKRGQLVSIALDNMARQIEASRRAQFRLPDLNEWKLISRMISELEAFHREILTDIDSQPLSTELDCVEIIKSKILFEVSELKRMRAKVSNLTPLATELSSKDHENLERFMEIAKEHQTDKATAEAFGIAIKLLGGLL